MALVGLFGLAMGLMGLFDPARISVALGLGDALPAHGLNTVRADFGAFFLAIAIGSFGALFAGRVNWLWLPILLFGMAALGRLLGIAFDGAPVGVMQPIVVEVACVVLSVVGLKTLPRR